MNNLELLVKKVIAENKKLRTQNVIVLKRIYDMQYNQRYYLKHRGKGIRYYNEKAKNMAKVICSFKEEKRKMLEFLGYCKLPKIGGKRRIKADRRHILVRLNSNEHHALMASLNSGILWKLRPPGHCKNRNVLWLTQQERNNIKYFLKRRELFRKWRYEK